MVDETRKIWTIEDMERYAYGGFTVNQLLTKVNDPILSSTSGYRSVLYGARLWAQYLTNFGGLAAIGQKTWDMSGLRLLTAASTVANPGNAEGANLKDTIKPTISPLTINATQSHITFEESSVQLHLEGKDNVVPWPVVVDQMGQEFRNVLNRALLADGDGGKPATGISSIDQLIGSYAEIAYGKVNNSAALDANDLDPYGSVDRDAGASWADCYVNGQAFGSGDRDLQVTHIDAMFSNVRKYWQNRSSDGKVILTGDDTLERIEQLLQSQQRFGGGAAVQRVNFTVNGVTTVAGTEVGFDVSSYKGVPIIPDANVLQDVISRIYLLDLERLWMGVLDPIKYSESEDYIAIGRISKVGMYKFEGEVTVPMFRCHAKGRDFQ